MFFTCRSTAITKTPPCDRQSDRWQWLSKSIYYDSKRLNCNAGNIKHYFTLGVDYLSMTAVAK